MNKQQIQVSKFFPHFYQSNSQISKKFGSFLIKIRQSNINSFQQLTQRLTNNQSSKSSLAKINLKKFINPKTSKKQLHKNVFHNGEDSKMNQTISGFNSARIKIADQRLSSRSPRTAKYSTLTPRTANLKRSKYISIDQTQNEQQLNDLTQLKFMMKMPFSSKGYSKIKKHLVDNIDLEEIQKVFYKKPNNITNIESFYAKLINKTSQQRNLKNFPTFRTTRFLNKTQDISNQKSQQQKRLQIMPKTHKTTRKRFWVKQKQVSSQKDVKKNKSDKFLGLSQTMVAGKTCKFQYQIKV